MKEILSKDNTTACSMLNFTLEENFWSDNAKCGLQWSILTSVASKGLLLGFKQTTRDHILHQQTRNFLLVLETLPTFTLCTLICKTSIEQKCQFASGNFLNYMQQYIIIHVYFEHLRGWGGSYIKGHGNFKEHYSRLTIFNIETLL